MKHARRRKELLFFSLLESVLDLDGSFSRRDGYKQTDWTHWTDGGGGLVKVCTCVAGDLLINFAFFAWSPNNAYVRVVSVTILPADHVDSKLVAPLGRVPLPSPNYTNRMSQFPFCSNVRTSVVPKPRIEVDRARSALIGRRFEEGSSTFEQSPR